tara:strand:+ start:16184 stop:16372 length:189 start_codon:yes stop_codon:yes gene_type:complete
VSLQQINAKFFGNDDSDCGDPCLRSLKDQYIKERNSGGCSGCKARRLRAKFEALIVKKLNGK